MIELLSIRIHPETYDLIRKMAEEDERKITTVIDRIVEAEWERRHPDTVAELPPKEV